MGFRLDRKYILEFDGAMAGAEVVIKATSVGTVLKLRDVNEITGQQELAELLATHIEEWNFEDADGQPLPITVEAIMDNIESVVLVRIAREWYKAATGVTAPLDGPSSMESTLEMEPL